MKPEPIGSTGRSRTRFAISILDFLAMGTAAPAARASYRELIDMPLEGQQTNQWCWAASGQMIFNYLGRPDISQCDQANKALGRNDCCGSQACAMDSDCTPADAVACDTSLECAPADAPACTPTHGCLDHEQQCLGEICSATLCRVQPSDGKKCSASVCGPGKCVPAVCVQGGGTDFVGYGFERQRTDCGAGLNFADFKAEIDAHRPLEFAWTFACKKEDSSHCSPACVGSPTMVAGGHVLVAAGYWIDDADPTNPMLVIYDPMPVNQGTISLLAYHEWQNTLKDPDGHVLTQVVYGITNKNPTTCPAGKHPVAGTKCCPNHDACGSGCCDAGDPMPDEDCGNSRCSDFDRCVDEQAGICCGYGQQYCDGGCCDPGASCVQNACCPAERSCGSVCCASNQLCKSGECVANPCEPGRKSCNGVCCLSANDDCCGPGGKCQEHTSCIK